MVESVQWAVKLHKQQFFLPSVCEFNHATCVFVASHGIIWILVHSYWGELGIGWKLLVCVRERRNYFRSDSKTGSEAPRLRGRDGLRVGLSSIFGCVRSEKCLQQHQRHGPIESLELSGTPSIMCPQSQTHKERWLWGQIPRNPFYKQS